METGSLNERYQAILRKIAEARAASPFPAPEVTLLAVSKVAPVDAIEALYRLGHRDFGENYVQELVEKAEVLARRGCSDIRWHFIGHLQTNKVKMLIPHVFAIHTVDSDKLARELAKRWKASGRSGRLPIFIEVNIDQEESKAGLTAQAAPDLARLISRELPELETQGLMCIPTADVGEEVTRSAFAKLRALEASCRPASKGALSMGMSSDFPLAIHEGATHVRVGTAIFGARKSG